MQLQETHHRHDHHHASESTPLNAGDGPGPASASSQQNAGVPLVHHMSLLKEEGSADIDQKFHASAGTFRKFLIKHSSRARIVGSCAFLVLLFIGIIHIATAPHIVPIEKAQEDMLNLGGEIEMWYRTWGNRKSGIPVLIVQCVYR